MLAFPVMIFLVGAVLILALVSSTVDYIPVRFDVFINPFVERLLANIKLSVIFIVAFVGASLGLVMILCANLRYLPEIRDVH